MIAEKRELNFLYFVFCTQSMCRWYNSIKLMSSSLIYMTPKIAQLLITHCCHRKFTTYITKRERKCILFVHSNKGILVLYSVYHWNLRYYRLSVYINKNHWWHITCCPAYNGSNARANDIFTTNSVFVLKWAK